MFSDTRLYRRIAFRAAVCLVGLLAGAFGTGCASDRAVIGQAQQVHSGLEPAVIEDPVLANYIQEVGDRVIEAAREYAAGGRGPKAFREGEDPSWMFSGGLKFHLVNSKTLNAFTTGGEHMYIYSELMQTCDSEDALAAVVAHEFAHVFGRHVHKGMNRQYATIGLAGAAAAAGYAAGGNDSGKEYAGMFGGAAMVAAQLINNGFTRKDENEADKYGFALYTRAGWDPDKFDDFFQELIDRGLDKPGASSTHPSLASRVEATRERVDRLPPDADRWRRPPVADAREFRRLQERAREVGARMPSDQTLAKAQTLLAAFPSCVTPEDQPNQKAAQQRFAEAVQRDAAIERQRRGGR